MIVEKQNDVVILEEGVSSQSIDMTLDLDSASMLMQMLSKNLYSDGIGSAIRETCSNALDSHRRAGVSQQPIIVSLKPNNQGNYEFSVEDFGLGLDGDDVENIISKYGKSTKRNSATELGMFGLGFKAPLAYSSTFYFVCRKNGMERKYSMYESDEMNKIDLIHESSTTERNGVKVVIPVKSWHITDFKKKIVEQLAYFENVFFDVEGMNNDFKIFRTDDYQYSEMVNDGRMHICLDNVYYPIDYSKLGIGSIDVPIGLRFSLSDGIYPTPNRESIRYTSEAKAIIVGKIEKVCTQLVQRFNDHHSTTDNVEMLYDFYRFDLKYYFIGDKRIDLKELLVHSSVPIDDMKLKNAHYSGFDYKSFFESGFAMLNESYVVSSRFDTRRFSSNTRPLYLPDLWNKNFHIINKEKLSNYDKSYIRSNVKNECLFVVKKQSINTLRGKKGYYLTLGLHKHPKSEWRNLIICAQKIVEHCINTYIKPSIEAPQDFIDGIKKMRKRAPSSSVVTVRKKRIDGEVNFKMGNVLEKASSKGANCKFTPKLMKISSVRKGKIFIIYGGEEQKELLNGLFPYMDRSKIRIALVGVNDEKLLNEANIHNCMNVVDFMKGNNKIFKRLVTAHIIYNFKNNNSVSDVFSRHAKLGGFLPFGMREKVDHLNHYTKENLFNSGANEVFQKMLDVAKEKNLYDYSIYGTFLEIKAFLEKHEWLPTIYDVASWSDAKVLKDVIVQLCKRNHIRLDISYYRLKQ